MRINIIEGARDVNENCHSRRMVQKIRFNIGGKRGQIIRARSKWPKSRLSENETRFDISYKSKVY